MAAKVAAAEVVAEAVEVVVVGKAVVAAVEEAAEMAAAAVVDPVSLVSSFLLINCSIPSDTNYFRRRVKVSEETVVLRRWG